MDWPKVKLGEVVLEMKDGGTPPRKNPDNFGGEINWCVVKDIRPEIFTTKEKLTESGLSNSSAKVWPIDSIIISLGATIGEVGIAKVPTATKQGLSGIVVNKEMVLPQFLAYSLKSKKRIIQSLATGVTIKEVRPPKLLSRLEIELPPLEEQRRIAAILDKADEVERETAKIQEMRDEIIQATFLDMFGDTHTNPFSHPTQSLSEVVSKGTTVTYGIVQAGPEYENGVPYIRTGDIKNGQIKETNLRKTNPKIASKFERSMVRSGELVISIRATVGTIAKVSESLHGANLTQGTARISPGEKVNVEYLLWFIRSQGSQMWISRQVKGATFREITLTKLRSMPILTPSIELQNQFADIVHQINAMDLSALETQATTLKQALTQELLA